MNEKIRQTKRTLENITGKKIEGDFDTVAQVYNAFNKDCEVNGAPGGGGGAFVVKVDWSTNTVITPLNDIRDAWMNCCPVMLFKVYDNSTHCYTLLNGDVRGDNGEFWSASFVHFQEGCIEFFTISEEGYIEYTSLDIEMTPGR